jgi:hypothetical protein
MLGEHVFTFEPNQHVAKLFSISLLLLASLMSIAQQALLDGRTVNAEGQAIPFVTVAVTNMNSGKIKGTTASEAGSFSIQLPVGTYHLKAHMLGYQDVDTLIQLPLSKHPMVLVMQSAENELATVAVYADRRDLAREVVSKAIDARAGHFRGDGSTKQYDAYLRTSVQMLTPDTTQSKQDSTENRESRKNRPLIKLQYHLSEAQLIGRWSAPEQYAETINGAQEYSTQKPRDNSAGVTMSFNYGESDILPQQWGYDDNYVLKSMQGFHEYDIYRRLLHIPSFCDKKILSPIGEGAMLSYAYDVVSVNDTLGDKSYTIRFRGLFPGEPLLDGTMNIRASDWAVTSIRYKLAEEVMKFYSDVAVELNYQIDSVGQAQVLSLKIEYVIEEGLTHYYGSLIRDSKPWAKANTDFVFTDEVRSYDVKAFDRDSLYWSENREVTFDGVEMAYIQKCDSLQTLYASDEYYEEADSTYNALRWMDFLLYGIGYRNRAKDYSFYINPLTMQVNPFGIGGYRHRVGGTFQKEFANAYTMEVEGEADYGFRNNDLRGRGGIGLTYIPLKFVRTFIRFGDYYDMVNNYASLGSIFSRSNYVRTQTWSIAQRMEVVNGLFAELTFEFSDQKPIVNLLSDRWSQQVFGDVNTPLDFERYIKSEFKLELKYRHRQRYVIKKGKKILLGSVYPELKFVYRKGVPGLLNSEVDFDYLEVGLKHAKTVGRLGDMDWSVLAGSFVNKRNLRLLEHRYFRGSDIFFFSDPLNSFQLLGPTLSTPNAFFRANYFHHFNGVLLNKIPLLHRLRLTEAAGAAMLSIPDENFHHVEFYAGIERVVRIKKELFRFGIYAATADSNWERAKFDLKFGVNFYNSFTKKWQY